MRFVRISINRDNNEIIGVSEHELPFAPGCGEIHQSGARCETVDIGLAEHFDSVAISGEPCAPSMHIFQRIEPDSSGGVRAKAGHSLPLIHEVPTTLSGLKSLVRAKGPAAIPERVAHWLEYMGALSDDEMAAAGLPRLTLSRALEFDAMRQKRDPSVGSRLEVFKRQLRERAARRKGGR